MKRATSRKVVPIRANQPKVPKTIRVPDGISKQQADSLQNLITGMGTAGRDKAVSTTFTMNFLDRSQQENAYRADWIARKVVTIPAQDATREWRTWQSDNADIEKIEDAERDLNLQKKMFTAMWKGRLYGGAALFLGVNNGTLDQELIPENVKLGELQYIHVLTRHELASGPMNWNIDSQWYGLPEYYTRTNQTGTGAPQDRIHPSRLIRFIGNEIPDLVQAQGWGDSVLQAVNDAVIAAGTSSAAGAQLLQELKMDIIKIPDLSASLANKSYEKRLLDRFGVANLAKSLYNILLLDKEEEWSRQTQPLTGLDDMLKMYLLIASGAADIPATRFVGQSPAGLSATGESDMRNYYDKVKSDQQTELTPNIDILDRVLIRSTLGEVKDGDVVYLWRPLWQMDDKQQSEIAKAKAETYNIDVTAAQIPPDVMRDARINQLIEDGTYPGLEQILDDYGPLETLENEEEPVALIGPDGQPLEPDPNALELPAAANQNLPGAEKAAVGDMARRIRDALSDGKRKKAKAKKRRWTGDRKVDTLYVRRNVTNGAAILAHYRKQGIPNLFSRGELHVTIMYSRAMVDWTKTGEAWGSNEDGTLTIKAGGMRTMEKFGEDSLVLLFNSNELQHRHNDLKYRCEAEWEYDSYNPHITIAEVGKDYDWSSALETVEPYQGVIELGVEVFEPVKTEGKYS